MNLPLSGGGYKEFAENWAVRDELRSEPTSCFVDKLWTRCLPAANLPEIPQRTHHQFISVHRLGVDKTANSAMNLLLGQPSLLHSV